MSGQSGPRPLFAYIDCVRGYAVTLVITCHLAYAFKELPYPLHRVVVMGWHGVQLFFLASALTLLTSWHYEVARMGRAQSAPFFLRRFFRIAPAYYAAAWLYYLLNPPSGGIDVLQLAASYAFINGWTPYLMPTVSGVWGVVPGGWSISVEFTFYILFPLFATLVTNLRRALALFGLCLVAGGLANRLAEPFLASAYPAVAVDNFLYFWFPDQMAVFALGGVLYFVKLHLERLRQRPLRENPQPFANAVAAAARRFAGWLTRHGNIAPALALILFFYSGRLPLPHWTGQAAPYLPIFIIAAVCLALFVLALALVERSLFINPLAAAMGRVSFSAYLLHFAAIQLLVTQNPALFHTNATGVLAIAAYAVAWVVVVALTFAAAWCTYQAVELPMMAFGKSLAMARWKPTAQLH